MNGSAGKSLALEGLRRLFPWLLALPELAVAVGFGWAAFDLALRGGCAVIAPACNGAGALAAVGAAIAVSIPLASAYWLTALKLGLGGRSRARLGLDLAAAAIAITHFSMQSIAEHRSAAAAQAAAETAAHDEASRRAAWIRALQHDSGSHGPPGVIPPMLSVTEHDGRVEVTNVTEAWLTVALARVKADPGAPGRWQACPLLTVGQVTESHRFSIGPGQTARFAPLGRCAAEFAHDAIEYRVGDPYAAERGWWSDSAFTKPEGWLR